MQGLENFLNQASGFIWGWPLIILLFGTHIYLTIRLGFIQRYIGRAIKISFQRTKEGEGDISHFGALTTALAATIGTGNIVGVATAVAAGGPGADLYRIGTKGKPNGSRINKLNTAPAAKKGPNGTGSPMRSLPRSTRPTP